MTIKYSYPLTLCLYFLSFICKKIEDSHKLLAITGKQITPFRDYKIQDLLNYDQTTTACGKYVCTSQETDLHPTIANNNKSITKLFELLNADANRINPLKRGSPHLQNGTYLVPK